MPLVMKVLLPLMTQSSPSRTAVVRMPCRSLPVPGSVIAIAVMSSPRATAASSVAAATRSRDRAGTRPRCRSSKPNAELSEDALARANSSMSTHRNRQSADRRRPTRRARRCRAAPAGRRPTTAGGRSGARFPLLQVGTRPPAGRTAARRHGTAGGRRRTSATSRRAGHEQFEDGGVGLAAALAHGLQAVADAVVAHVVHAAWSSAGRRSRRAGGRARWRRRSG